MFPRWALDLRQGLEPHSGPACSPPSEDPREEMAVGAQRAIFAHLGSNWLVGRGAPGTEMTWASRETGRKIERGTVSKTEPGRKLPADIRETGPQGIGEKSVEETSEGRAEGTVDEIAMAGVRATDESATRRETTTGTRIERGRGTGRRNGAEREAGVGASALAEVRPTAARRRATRRRRWSGSRAVRANSCASGTTQTASGTEAPAPPGAEKTVARPRETEAVARPRV